MIRYFYLLALAGLLGGCASGGATFNSKVNAEGVERINRIFVLSNAESKYFNDGLRKGFHSGLSSNLEKCDIELKVLPYDEMDLNFSKTFESAVDEFRPDALMLMKRSGGNVSVGNGGNSGTLYFDLQMQDMRDDRTIWVSKMGFSFLTGNMFTNDIASGENLGVELFERLRTDEILAYCPSADAEMEGEAGAKL